MTRRKFLRLTTLGVMGAGLAVDATAIEPRRIQVTTHDVPLNRLPRELDGFKIVQLSDLHRGYSTPDSIIRKSVTLANDLQADIALTTGDYVSHWAENSKQCAKMLSGLKTKMGTYAVLGNHDHWTDANIVRKHLEEHEITILTNERVSLAPGLDLLGIDDFWVGKADCKATWRQADPDAAHVFVSHNPLAVREIKHHDCLMITGHTHGGQVNLPFISRDLLPGMKGWRYIQGWYHVGKVNMYVNRGIGMVAPPIRFLCRPEVTLYVLRSA